MCFLHQRWTTPFHLDNHAHVHTNNGDLTRLFWTVRFSSAFKLNYWFRAVWQFILGVVKAKTLCNGKLARELQTGVMGVLERFGCGLQTEFRAGWKPDKRTEVVYRLLSVQRAVCKPGSSRVENRTNPQSHTAAYYIDIETFIITFF